VTLLDEGGEGLVSILLQDGDRLPGGRRRFFTMSQDIYHGHQDSVRKVLDQP